jgi:TatD DNase family protein
MLEIAETNNKPVIVHNREATKDIIDNLKKHQVKGIIHCFSGSLETAKDYLKLGFKLGINGILTFKKSNLPETLINIELKHLLLETDAPYISPEPVRKEKNEPKNIIHTAQKLADIFHIDLDTLSEELERNFEDIFDI